MKLRLGIIGAGNIAATHVQNVLDGKCPDCGKRHFIFGESRLEEIAAQYGIKHTARLPIDPAIARSCDQGAIEAVDSPWLDDLADAISSL